MKFLSRLFNIIAGINHLILTIGCFFGLFFSVFVSKDLLLSFYDLLGFDNINSGIVKPLTLGIFAFAFIIALFVTKRIFKSNKTGKYFLSNIFFGILFAVLAVFLYIFVRNNIFLYALAVEAILILGSIFGLVAKANGQYDEILAKNSKNKVIENDTNKEIIDGINNSLIKEEKDAVIDSDSINEETIIEEDKINPVDKDEIVNEVIIDEDASTVNEKDKKAKEKEEIIDENNTLNKEEVKAEKEDPFNKEESEKDLANFENENGNEKSLDDDKDSKEKEKAKEEEKISENDKSQKYGDDLDDDAVYSSKSPSRKDLDKNIGKDD